MGTRAGDQRLTALSAVTSQVEKAAGNRAVNLRDPYPFFARKRRESAVFCGTVMDYSKTPQSLRPEREYSAMSFNAVNAVFRDSRVFTSKPYDATIGLFMGPTILAMDGKKHRDHRDERRWERAEEFDIFRKHMPHISFAAGEHTCLGLHLARLETRVALECPLSRMTNVNLLTDSDPHIFGQPFRSPTALPVTFEAK
jgi:cytochrome P450